MAVAMVVARVGVAVVADLCGHGPVTHHEVMVLCVNVDLDFLRTL